MSLTWVAPRVGVPPRSSPAAWWSGLTLLFILEGVLLSLGFHVPRIAAGSGWWLIPLIYAPKILFPGFLAGGAMAVLGGIAASSTRGRLLSGAAPAAARARALVAHLATLALFVAITGRVCDIATLAGRWSASWALAWYASGLAVMATWLFALHADTWRATSRPRLLGILLTGLAVAAVGILSSSLSGRLWVPLAWGTLVLVRTALGVFGTDVVCHPAEYSVGVEAFTVRIAPACSGYEGIGLVWAFLAAYLAWSRRSLRWPHAWSLLVLGTAAIWLINSARITALILIGAWVSPDVAVGGFHSHAGTIGFLVISLGLVLLSRRSRFFMAAGGDPAAEVPAGGPAATANPTAAYLVPFLAVVATTMATGALAAGFDALYPLRIVAGAVALWAYRRGLAGALFDWSWLAVVVGLGVFGLWVALEPANPAGAAVLESSWHRLPPAWAATWLGFRVVGSVVVIPVAEEWAFRGYLTRRLIASDFESVPPGRFTWPSFLLSSLAFGLLHGRWFAGTLAGLIYAGVYYRRGRVGEAALAHAVTNGCIAATVLATRDWSYWS